MSIVLMLCQMVELKISLVLIVYRAAKAVSLRNG